MDSKCISIVTTPKAYMQLCVYMKKRYLYVNLRSNFRAKAEKGHGWEISFLYREQAFHQGTHTEHFRRNSISTFSSNEQETVRYKVVCSN